MATADISKANSEHLKSEWLRHLSALIDAVQNWAQELGWATRRIDKRMEDSEIGTYQAPALLMQEETTRVFLEPIARSAPDAEGRVDLYVMPAYDEIANLYFSNGQWQLLYLAPDAAVSPTSLVESKPLTKATLQEVLRAMRKNAA